jgi:hypothetical protein
MTASTADTAALQAALQQGREEERRSVLLWLDVVVQFQLHVNGDAEGSRLLQRVAERIEQCEHIGGA